VLRRASVSVNLHGQWRRRTPRLRRPADHDYTLQPPEAAIDPSEDEVSINAAIAMRATFVQVTTLQVTTYRVECPQLRRRMSAYRRDDGPLRVDSGVERPLFAACRGVLGHAIIVGLPYSQPNALTVASKRSEAQVALLDAAGVLPTAR